MTKVLPTLDSAGWIRDVSGLCDRLMAYYFTSEFSQSDLYLKNIVSLPAQVQQYGHNDQELIDNVTSQLNSYLGRYFDTAEVNATTARPNPADPNRTNLTVAITVTKGNIRYSLGHEIQVMDSKILKITQLNNYGER